MRIARTSAAEFRGAQTPSIAAPLGTAPTLSPSKGPTLASPGQPIQPDGFRASQVLRRSLNRWDPLERDSYSLPTRFRSAGAYAGMGRICGTAAMTKHPNQHYPYTDVTMTPGGILVFGAMSENSARGHIVSAKIEGDGSLQTINEYALSWGIPVLAPLIMSDPSLVAVPGITSMEIARVAPDGAITKVLHTSSPICITVLKEGRLAWCDSEPENMGMAIGAYNAATQRIEVIARAPIPVLHSVGASITSYAGTLILADRQFVSTYAVDDTKLTAINNVRLAENDASVQVPVVTPHGVVLAAARYGVLHALPLAGDGSIRSGGQLPFTGEAYDGPALVGNIAILGTNDGTLRTVAVSPQGTLTELDRFKAGGGIRARPTVTRDNVVLFGADDGYAYALQMDPDGGLHEITRRNLGSVPRCSLTVTANGFILAPTRTGLIALKD